MEARAPGLSPSPFPIMLLSGTKGADILTGILGQTDQITVNHSGDIILNSEGRDVIVSSITFDMGASEAQYLVLSGRAAIDAFGTAKAEVIAGNNNDNIINGGAGQDRLVGNRGADTFRFDHFGAANADIIEDFSGSQGDIIALSGSVFGLAADTALTFSEGAAFGAGPTVFRDETSQLFFDVDGSGNGEAKLFAQCRAQGLNSSSFVIV